MEIRFKGGKPLMVGGGLIAGSQTCCCENPPPPACYCPDFCSYFSEVLSPSRLAVKSPVVVCDPPQNYIATNYHPDYEFPDLLFDPEWTYSSIEGSQYSQGFATNFAAFGQIEAGVRYGAVHMSPVGECASVIDIGLYARLWVFCGNAETNSDQSAFGNVPILRASYGVYFNMYNRNNSGCVKNCIAGLVYNKFIPLSTKCFYNSDRVCPSTFGALNPGVGYRHIQTPLDISIELSGVTVGGAFFANNEAVSYNCVDPDPEFVDFVNRTVDEHAATFRITSRPSCNNVPADCEVPLQGNRIIYFGTAADRDFVLGTPKSTTTGPISGGVTVNYEHYGTAGGTTADPWVFNAKIVRDEDNRTIEEHNVELFCGLDESVSPAVSRWYIREYTYCTPDFGQQTTGQWISVVESYPASNDCNGIAIGDPVPIGSPDYEEVDGYPVVDFGDPCVPPAPIGLEITDLCP